MENIEEIYEKYAQAFPDGTNEYDFEAYKEKIAYEDRTNEEYYNHDKTYKFIFKYC